jgi:hypothetical protein
MDNFSRTDRSGTILYLDCGRTNRSLFTIAGLYRSSHFPRETPSAKIRVALTTYRRTTVNMATMGHLKRYIRDTLVPTTMDQYHKHSRSSTIFSQPSLSPPEDCHIVFLCLISAKCIYLSSGARSQCLLSPRCFFRHTGPKQCQPRQPRRFPRPLHSNPVLSRREAGMVWVLLHLREP